MPARGAAAIPVHPLRHEKGVIRDLRLLALIVIEVILTALVSYRVHRHQQVREEGHETETLLGALIDHIHRVRPETLGAREDVAVGVTVIVHFEKEVIQRVAAICAAHPRADPIQYIGELPEVLEVRPLVEPVE
jgi:hypothetical protein